MIHTAPASRVAVRQRARHIKLVAPAIGAIATVVLLTAPAAQAESKYTDVRVVTNTGLTLTDIRQYTDDVKVKTSVAADCFGPSNPSTGDSYNLKDPNVLGALIDASKSDSDLKPLMITDGFVDDGFGFGVCDIGGLETEGFSYWYSSVNGVGSSTGPDLIPVKNGDSNLWYLTTGEEPGFPSELVLKAPARVLAGEQFTAKVVRVLPDGSKEPAEGADVNGFTTDEKGEVELDIGTPGDVTLRATGEADDVPSAEVNVCVGETLSDCPKGRGLEIFGSPGDDEIESTRGEDLIDCGKGRDVVRNVQNADVIAVNCEKVRRA
jgi:hypothetical protein